MEEIREFVLKYVFINVYMYRGKVNLKVVIGKVFGENLEFRKRVKEIIFFVNEVVNEVNFFLFEE